MAMEASDGLTLEQQIGQLFVVGFSGMEPTRAVLDLIQRQFVGSIILFTRNLRDTRQTRELTSALQEAAHAAGHPYPLLITTDQENGLVRRLGTGATVFPGNMALGATGSEELVYEVARATGDELRALGINTNLAPVVDVNNNPLNPVIGVRSFGEDAEAVGRLGAAAVRGYHDAGVIATLKHFPGHGDTATDSHRALPEVPFDLERLERIELVPFRSGIATGAEMVMTAHLYMPALMSGETLPASLSPAIVRGLLRGRLGYGGAVMTDCLEMDAVAETVGVPRGAVLALLAGSDLVLVSHSAARQNAALEAVRRAVASGELSADAVGEAAARVARLKRRYLLWDAVDLAEPGLAAVGSAAHHALSERAYALSTTLVRDEVGSLPVRPGTEERILIVARPMSAITPAAEGVFAEAHLAEAVRRHARQVESRVLMARAGTGDAPSERDEREIIEAARAADLVVLVTLNAHRDPEQLQFLRAVAGAARRSVGVAVYDPYDAGALPEVPTFLATYEYTQPALEAAVRALFGQAPVRGRLPVTVTA